MAGEVVEERRGRCPHRVLRKKSTAEGEKYAFEAYVCGQCGQLFEVSEHKEPAPSKAEPMFDRRPPWGSRVRQA